MFGFLELVMCVIMIVTVAKLADADGQSPWIWGAVAFGMTIGCMWIPLPFGRVLLAGLLTVGTMVGYKMMSHK